MNVKSKPWLLILSVVIVAALFLLAIGLSQVELRPGNPEIFSFGSSNTLAQNTQSQNPSDYAGIIRIIYIIGLALLPVTIILLIVSKSARKQFLRSLVAILPLIMLLIFFQQIAKQNANQKTATLPSLSGPQAQVGAGNQLLISVDKLPPWLIIAGTVLVALVVTGLALGIAWFFFRRSHTPPDSIDLIAKEAQDALDALKSGANLKNVVIRCYYQMNEIINEERGVRRDEAMTPREFIKRLESIGLPGSAVAELTRLFEEVRYGTHIPGLEDEVAAMASLNSIVDACKAQ